MATVRGDRIAHSQKLGRCTAEAQTAYHAFVAMIPDQFGRYYHHAWTIVIRLFPKRDDEREIVRLQRTWRRYLAQYVEHGLVRTWVVDGRTFGELTNFSATGNVWHRTPEPPGSDHQHTGACLSTAIYRARDVGQEAQAARLSAQLEALRSGARRRRNRRAGDPEDPLGAPEGAPALPNSVPPKRRRESDGESEAKVVPSGTETLQVAAEKVVMTAKDLHRWKGGGEGGWKGGGETPLAEGTSVPSVTPLTENPPTPRERGDHATPTADDVTRVLRAFPEAWAGLATEQHAQRAVRRRLKVLPVERVVEEVQSWASLTTWLDLPDWILSKDMERRARNMQR